VRRCLLLVRFGKDDDGTEPAVVARCSVFIPGDTVFGKPSRGIEAVEMSSGG
jgi:hypothetical protein